MVLRDVQDELSYNKNAKVYDREVPLSKTKSYLGKNWVKQKKKKEKFIPILLIMSFLFFLVSVGIAFFVNFFDIDRSVSANKIDIFFEGPSIVVPNKETPFTIKIINRNPVGITSSTLLVSYPKGTRELLEGDKEPSRVLTREIVVGKISSGGYKNLNIEPIFLGQDEEAKKIYFNYKYKVQNTTARFEKEKELGFSLKGTLFSFSEINTTNIISGKEFNINTSIISNNNDIFKKVIVEAHYPSNFSVRDTFPKTIKGINNLWEFDNFGGKDSTKNINIRGLVRGDSGLKKGIIFNVYGSKYSSLQKDVVLLSTLSNIFKIEKPFIETDIDFGLKDLRVEHGKKITAILDWRGVDETKYKDVEFKIKLLGAGLDESKIKYENGVYDAVNKVIVFNQKNNKALELVNVGYSGEIEFGFGSVPAVEDFSNYDKEIRISLGVTAVNTETSELIELDEIFEETIKLRNDIRLEGNTYYGDEENNNIENIGPIPPVVGETTSYTLKYSIANFGNVLLNVSVKIPLRAEVKFTGKVFGLGENDYSFNEDTNTIEVDIKSIAGFGRKSKKDLEFQVFIKPTSRYVGDSIDLTKPVVFTAEDSFVDEKYKKVLGAFTSTLSDTDKGLDASSVIEVKE